VEYAALMLNDLTLVAFGSTHHPSELNAVNTKANAEDLADQVLIGPRFRQLVVMLALSGMPIMPSFIERMARSPMSSVSTTPAWLTSSGRCKTQIKVTE
jgi:hypothetical protein